jgi:hypothetical protein
MYSRDNIRSGMTVYSSDDQKVCTISEVGNTHFKCDTGFMGLGKDLYIPFSDITRCQGNDCYLDVAKDRLNQMNWDRQPVGWMSY